MAGLERNAADSAGRSGDGSSPLTSMGDFLILTIHNRQRQGVLCSSGILFEETADDKLPIPVCFCNGFDQEAR